MGCAAGGLAEGRGQHQVEFAGPRQTLSSNTCTPSKPQDLKNNEISRNEAFTREGMNWNKINLQSLSLPLRLFPEGGFPPVSGSSQRHWAGAEISRQGRERNKDLKTTGGTEVGEHPPKVTGPFFFFWPFFHSIWNFWWEFPKCK